MWHVGDRSVMTLGFERFADVPWSKTAACCECNVAFFIRIKSRGAVAVGGKVFPAQQDLVLSKAMSARIWDSRFITYTEAAPLDF